MVSDMRIPGLVARWGTSLLVSALFVTMLALAGATSRTPISLTPSATNTYLCSGYSGCRSAGYSDAGYGAVNNKMYWRMYSGHNCTNYVAYRMIKAGMSTTRPWSGGGNASEWGLQMRSITDQVPNVGAVAWWARYDNGSGSAGHVAYVEKVISSTEIIVSQDSWGGTFSWRRISKDSGRWPTGFIHFVDKRIDLKAKPAVDASPVVGTPLTVTTPSFTVTPSAVSYRWIVGGVSTGVSGQTYTPRAADLGKSVAVRIRAVRSGYTEFQSDVPVAGQVAKGTMVLTGDPTVSGEPMVDETLVADAGSWSPTPRATTWRWYADGQLIKQANYTNPKLALDPTLVGRTISVMVSSIQDGYTVHRLKPLVVGKVLAGTIEVQEPFTVSGRPRVGETLTVAGGTHTPEDVAVAYTWLRNGLPIAGATGATYRLTGADAGSHVSVRTDLSRANYAPWTAETPASGRIMSTSSIRHVTGVTGARGRTGYVVARVLAPGVAPVTGQVHVRIGGQTATVKLVDGVARVRLRLRGTGPRNVVVRYLGSDSVTAARITDQIVLR